MASDSQGRRWETVVLAAILLAAGIHFYWGLGDSSYFVDEVFSLVHSMPDLAQLRELVRTTESTPYTYFYGLHFWLNHGGSVEEAAARGTSALAGVGLVGATYWMARAFLARRPALVAAGLTALSPLVLEYAQQVRVYVWMMLATAIAVGATVRAARGGRRRLLLVGAAAAVLALWLHYTALLVIAPLCVWVAVRGALSVRARVAYIGACALAELLVAPLLADQYGFSPNGGALADAALSQSSVVRLLGTPFDGRWVGGTDVWRLVAVAATVAAVAVVWQRGRAASPEVITGSRLLVVLGAVAPLALIVAGIAGKDILVTRYAAASVPLLLTALAAALALLPRRAAGLLALALALATFAGLVRSHGSSGQYPPTRQAIDFIARDLQAGDAVLTPGAPGIDAALAFYAGQRLQPVPPLAPITDPGARNAVRQLGGRIWVIGFAGAPVSERDVIYGGNQLARTIGYRTVRARVFTTSITLYGFLSVPSKAP